MELTPLAELSLPPGQVRLRSADGGVQFAGELVATSSSDSGFKPDKDKWTELELWRKTDDSGQYVLHIIARSVVYHRQGGCNNGVPIRLAELSKRYLDVRCTEPIPEPCIVCKPLDIEARLRDSDIIVNAETDWHTIYVCNSVSELLANLRQTKGKNAGQFGMPALVLLDRARQADAHLAAELNQVRAI